MKNSPSKLALIATITLALSCSSGDEQKPSTGEVTKYCIYKDTRKCYTTTQATCPVGGEMGDFCPYEGSSVASSSSVPIVRSSSSVVLSSSSSAVFSSSSTISTISSSSSSRNKIGDYCNWYVYGTVDYCYPITNETEREDCLMGGKEIVVACPNSSSSVVPSSSSIAPSSSSSSIMPSSSSSACTAANNTATQYCSNGTMKQYGSVTYGGKTYKTVVIGTQTWMAENLQIGAKRSYVNTDNCFYNGIYNISASMCYDDKEANCTTYGRLYKWATAMALPDSCYTNTDKCLSQISAKHKGICPSGWHIPSLEEWNVLMKFVNPSCTPMNNPGGNSVCSNAGTKLKAVSGWTASTSSIASIGCNKNGTDDYGFSALLSGSVTPSVTYDMKDNSCTYEDKFNSNFADWWISTTITGSYIGISINCSSENAQIIYPSYRLISVRCLQD